jgi:regulator of replication initiation timing
MSLGTQILNEIKQLNTEIVQLKQDVTRLTAELDNVTFEKELSQSTTSTKQKTSAYDYTVAKIRNNPLLICDIVYARNTGHTVKETAAKLNLSPGYVSHLLWVAKKSGYISKAKDKSFVIQEKLANMVD